LGVKKSKNSEIKNKENKNGGAKKFSSWGNEN
jgi:hypothetical protein